MSRQWYGSLDNRILERCRGEEPKVGMGVTHFGYTDRHPYEIVRVIDDRHLEIRALDHKRIDNNGMSECQKYEYFSNENNPIERLFKNKSGRWVLRVGRNGVDNYGGWYIGEAEYYYDYSF